MKTHDNNYNSGSNDKIDSNDEIKSDDNNENKDKNYSNKNNDHCEIDDNNDDDEKDYKDDKNNNDNILYLVWRVVDHVSCDVGESVDDSSGHVTILQPTRFPLW